MNWRGTMEMQTKYMRDVQHTMNVRCGNENDYRCDNSVHITETPNSFVFHMSQTKSEPSRTGNGTLSNAGENVKHIIFIFIIIVLRKM